MSVIPQQVDVIRVVVADDQAIVREGLTAILDALENVVVVGAAASGLEAIAVVTNQQPDIVLMDIQMPELDGIEATRRLHENYPGVAVVVLTTYTDEETILQALSAGAIGYLTKNASLAQIRRALEAATCGQAVLDRDVQSRLIDHVRTVPGEAAPDAIAQPPDGLSTREAEVLGLIATGLSNSEIAERLFISRATVKGHINQILRKTGCRDRSQAIVYAIRNDVGTASSP